MATGRFHLFAPSTLPAAAMLLCAGCSIFKPWYPAIGVTMTVIERYESILHPEAADTLDSAQVAGIKNELSAVAYGMANKYAAMFKAPPPGFQRPEAGTVTIEILTGPEGKAEKVSIVEDTFNYEPLKKELLRAVSRSNFRSARIERRTAIGCIVTFSKNLDGATGTAPGETVP